MNKLFYKSLVITGLFLFLASMVFSQGIRKEYQEMTNAERIALMQAYWDWTIGGGSGTTGLNDNIADFHAANFNNIHFNNAPNDVFLAWHRQASHELEREMKDQMGNEWINLGYWDWTTSNTSSSPLWNSSWIGQFDGPWNLNRVFQNNWDSPNFHLPSQVEVNNALAQPNFFQFSRWDIESERPHVAAHVWVGGNPPVGVMASGNSPKDPAFFFHHNMIDKLWADWYEIHGVAGANYYAKTDMPRFDGTYVRPTDGHTLPAVDPDDIVDPRSLGIFYAESGLATLDKYTVANIDTPDEKFGYQYTIEAKDNFIVPSGKSATFKSCNEIVLKPGFHAASGSTFHAKIDADCDFMTPAKQAFPVAQEEEEPEEWGVPILENVYAPYLNEEKPQEQADIFSRNDENELPDNQTLSCYPNPFHSSTTIAYTLPEDATIRLTVQDLSGRLIKELVNTPQLKGNHQIEFNGSDLPAGMYIVQLQSKEGVQTTKLSLVR